MVNYICTDSRTRQIINVIIPKSKCFLCISFYLDHCGFSLITCSLFSVCVHHVCRAMAENESSTDGSADEDKTKAETKSRRKGGRNGRNKFYVQKRIIQINRAEGTQIWFWHRQRTDRGQVRAAVVWKSSGNFLWNLCSGILGNFQKSKTVNV